MPTQWGPEMMCVLSEVLVERDFEPAALLSPSGLCSYMVSRNTACLALLVAN